MSTLFGQMASQEITAIKIKMPITKSFEYHQQHLKQLQVPLNSNDFSYPVHKSEEATIGEIRAIFHSKR